MKLCIYKLQFLAILIANICLNTVAAEDYSAEVRKTCSDWKMQRCKSDCSESERGRFTECYMDPEYAGKMRWRDCYALHVGFSCPPCQDFFATNFGGSFKKASCEYFYSALEKKNKNCGNCLQKISHLQVDPSDLIE